MFSLFLAAVVSVSQTASADAGNNAAAANAVRNAPVQQALANRPVFKKAGHKLTAVAAFEVSARVLSAKQYRKGREARLAPVDLALGWGKMATDRFLSNVSVSQAGRFASVKFADSAVRKTDIVHNMSNMHMIPESAAVKRKLAAVKKGQRVKITGYLVNINHKDGWRWLTSLSRKDTGLGACEIVLVSDVEIYNG